MSTFIGNLLEINLTNKQIRTLELGEEFTKKWIGGVGIGVKLLFDNIKPGTDPFDPQNPLMFLTGPLVGTRVPNSGKHSVIARSPLTGGWGESDIGGRWGAKLRYSGYDGLIIRGSSSVPCYIFISDHNVELRSAEHIWGKDTYQTTSLLQSELGTQTRIQCIGPAGEQLVLFASIMDGDGRAAGRGGLGAVMGSKLLKAIAVSSTQHFVQVAHPEALDQFSKQKAKEISNRMAGAREFGTPGDVMHSEIIGDLPTRNWTVGEWHNAENISGERLRDTILKGRYYCQGCVIGCGREVQIESGKYTGIDGAGPEYEGIGSLGSLCYIDDLEAVAAANELCNRYGLDVISTGSVIAFAMEANEKGLLGSDYDQIHDLKWGNTKGLIDTIHYIGQRKGFGKILGMGVKRASEELGLGSEDFVLEVKGLELPMHDPRAISSLAVAYATNPRGACHRGLSHFLEEATLSELGYDQILDRFATKGKGKATAIMQDYSGLFNCLKLCHFIISCISPSEVVEILNLSTGWDFSLISFLKTGEMIFNLKRLYNFAHGITGESDTLPKRIMDEPLKQGGATGYVPDLKSMLEEYYQFRGWDFRGIPTLEKCQELNLVNELTTAFDLNQTLSTNPKES